MTLPFASGVLDPARQFPPYVYGGGTNAAGQAPPPVFGGGAATGLQNGIAAAQGLLGSSAATVQAGTGAGQAGTGAGQAGSLGAAAAAARDAITGAGYALPVPNPAVVPPPSAAPLPDAGGGGVGMNSLAPQQLAELAKAGYDIATLTGVVGNPFNKDAYGNPLPMPTLNAQQIRSVITGYDPITGAPTMARENQQFNQGAQLYGLLGSGLHTPNFNYGTAGLSADQNQTIDRFARAAGANVEGLADPRGFGTVHAGPTDLNDIYRAYARSQLQNVNAYGPEWARTHGIDPLTGRPVAAAMPYEYQPPERPVTPAPVAATAPVDTVRPVTPGPDMRPNSFSSQVKRALAAYRSAGG